MTRLSTPISKHLHNVETWATCTTELRNAFRDVMRGHAYGQDATRQAWHFFYCGWFKAGGATHHLNVCPPDPIANPPCVTGCGSLARSPVDDTCGDPDCIAQAAGR